MHIVLVHRYFWPDTPLYASLLRVLGQELADNGHRVTVLTAQPSYTGAQGSAPAREEPHPGMEVRRFRLLPESRKLGPIRAANSVLFAARVLIAGLRLGRLDVAMAATAPPILVARATATVARHRGAAFVYHNQDIYPEVAVAAGLLRRKRVAALLRQLDRANHRRAARVVVLSEDMRRTVEARGIPADRISIINNFDPFTNGALERRKVRKDTEKPLGVVFAGNLGRFQGLEVLIDVAQGMVDLPITFHFVGDGVARPALEARSAQAGVRNVRFHGYMPPTAVEEFVCREGDVGIVSLRPGVIRAAYPSKTFTYLGQGCPIVALVEGDSELARTLEHSGVGFACEPGDAVGLTSILERCLADRRLVAQMGERATGFAIERTSRERRLKDWLRLFDSLASYGVARSDVAKGPLRWRDLR